jgi:hypothetical protein
MRRSSYGTVGFYETVTSVVHTGPAMSDVIGERYLDDYLGDDGCNQAPGGGGEGRKTSVSSRNRERWG